jgi:hypothetical protein
MLAVSPGIVLSPEFIDGAVLAESIEPPVPPDSISLPELSPHAIKPIAAANTNANRFIEFSLNQ